MRTISSTGNRRRTARNRVLSPARAPRSNFSDIALSASLLVYLALQIYLTSSLDATATPSPVGPPSFRTIERPSNSLLATSRHGSPTDSETSEAEGSLDHIQHSRVDYPSIGMRGLQSTTCLSSISFPPPDDGTAFTLGRDDSTFYLMSVTPDVDNSHFYGVGVLDVTASHSSFVVVLYFNASLGVEWSKRIPTGTAQLATTTFLLTSGVLTSNGFAFPYFANFNTASGGQVLVAEFTRDGVMTWSAVFGSAGGDEYGYQLACAPGTGDLYVVGTAPSPDGTERGGGFVAKLSPSGQLMWFTTVTVGAMNGVVVGDSGDVFISGFDSMSSTTSSTSTLLAKLDPDGTVMWANVYMHALSGISTELGPLSLSPTSGYIASSGRFRDTQSVLSGSIVVVFNQSGGVVWSRYLNSSGSADALLLTAWAPDGTLVSCGQTFIQPVGDEQVLCVRFSAAGELLWSFVTGGRGIDFGNGMLFTKDGGMVVVGFTTSYGVGKFNGFIIRTESYAGVPVTLGAITVINTTSVWPTVTAIVTSMRLTDSLSLFTRLNISAAPFITSTLNQSVVLPVTLSRTALTYTLNRQAFPSVPNALLLFPWTYQLPHSPYIGVPGNSLSVDVLPFSTNTNWISLTRSGITASLIGVPIFTEQSNEPYSVSLQYSAVILGVGLHTFPPITVAVCVTTSFLGRFDLLQLDTFLEGQLPAYTTGLSVLNGSKLLAGSLHVSSGPTTASLALLSPRGDYEWLWNLYELSSLDASDHSTFLALALTANDSAIAVGVANGNIEAVVTKLSLSHQISTSYTFHGVATSVIGLPDGSAMIGGYSVMAVDGYDAGLVLRLSQTGDLMWSRLYSAWDTHVYVHTMCVSSPNTTVVGGYTTTSVKDDTGALLFQITWDGDITWSEVFGGLGNDTLESVHSLPTPIGVVFTGSTSSVGAGGLDVLIGCALVNGSMCWLSVFGGPRDDAGSSVYVDDMGGITVTGYISSFDSAGFGGQDIVIASLYGDGSLAWALDVGTDSDDVGNAVLSYDAVVGVSVLGTSSHLNPPGPVVVVCSANGTMSPNVAVGHATVTNQLGFALWDEAFWLSSTLSSFASDPSFLELTAAPEAVSVNGHALTESLDFFNLPLLPPPVCQVPFAKPFNLSLSSAIGLIAQFVSVVEQGAVSLPSWLQVTSTSVLIGTPLGPIRGFYSLVLTVSAGSPSAFNQAPLTTSHCLRGLFTSLSAAMCQMLKGIVWASTLSPISTADPPIPSYPSTKPLGF